MVALFSSKVLNRKHGFHTKSSNVLGMPFSVLFSCVHFIIFSDKKLEPESHLLFLLLSVFAFIVSETGSEVIIHFQGLPRGFLRYF